MLIDGRSVDKKTTIETEVAVIGAGAAGISLALSLAKHNVKVAVVESGGLEPDSATQALADGISIGQDNHPLISGRLRYFGGTTNHWSGWCRSLEPIDLVEREWIPHSGWPITFDELNEFYPRARELCEIGPGSNELRDWNIPHNLELRLPLGMLMTRLISFSPPTRFGEVYREQLRQSDQATVFLNSNLTSIDAANPPNTVDHVTIKCLDGNEFRIRAREYVLASGGIENARLLLASNEVETSGLGNGYDVVGRYYHNHIHLPAGAILFTDGSFDDRLYTQRLGYSAVVGESEKFRLFGHFATTPKAQAEHRILNCSFNIRGHDLSDFYIRDESTDRFQNSNVLTSVWNAIKNIDDLATLAWSKAASIVDPNATLRLYELVNMIEQSPNPESRILLDVRKDALDMPITKRDWRLQELDYRSIRTTHELIGRELGAAGLGRVYFELDENFDAWPSDTNGDFHHMGSTRMHDSPRSGVVDRNCKVHGVSNLFVAGSSVFPTGGYANPTLTLVALAVRLGDHLKRKTH